MLEEHFDIIVVGAGHAGCEAALVASRMGAKTLLVTMDIDRVAQMSCNPAIGGLGKGHLVREIDALGGQMGKTIDETGIHFKMLGQSRGPAVFGPRAQADKLAYQSYMKKIVESTENLTLRQDRIEGLLVTSDCIKGLKSLTGTCYYAPVVILTTGTFLNGKIHMGLNNYSGGRASEPGTGGCSNSLKDMGFDIGRLKTGTPPRINALSIDFSVCEPQYGDEKPHYFSYETAKNKQMKQVPCYITHTNEKTHEIIKNSLDRSPMYSGAIQSVGPRYCPSIEDKVVKFAHRDRHQIFLEPEGINTLEVYCNGISTSLPPDVQVQYLRSIKGLEKAQIMRFGYAVEYDFVYPTQIFASLETKKIEGLFLAGQINGTTGYEEAATQGIIAGINGVRKIKREDPLILTRDQAYMGVLVDDLVTRGTEEPYRMFTSRAEYRLILRQDNADRRLMPIGYELGLIKWDTYKKLQEKEAKITELKGILKNTRYGKANLAKLLRRPEVNMENICREHNLSKWLEYEDVVEQVEIEMKYEGYIERQEMQVQKFRKMESTVLSPDIDYYAISTLSNEAQEKLAKHTPASLGQASRISGITPADISVLLIYISGNKLPCKNS